MNALELFLADFEKLCVTHNILPTCTPSITLLRPNSDHLMYPNGMLSGMYIPQQQVDITLNVRALLEGNVQHDTDNRLIHPALRHDYQSLKNNS